MTSRPGRRAAPAVILLVLSAACAPAVGGVVCTAGPGHTMEPEELEESSGVAWSHSDPSVFWTVNDGPDGILFAIDTAGGLVGRYRTEGGRRLRDVEALTSGPCDLGWCLYLGDVGDNGERRNTVAIHRIREPRPGEGGVLLEREAFRIRYPDGPQDVEAMFMIPGEGLHLVSKGRSKAPTVYRYPGELTSDSVVTLERIQALGTGRRARRDMVTGATWIPGTDRVLIRTYSDLEAYRLVAGRLEPVPDGVLSLGPLREPQGEAVGADAAGRVVLTTEGGPFRKRSAFHTLRCEVPEAAAPGD